MKFPVHILLQPNLFLYNIFVQGFQGPAGNKGDRGHPGKRGYEGQEGLKGESGKKGDVGPPGEDGRPVCTYLTCYWSVEVGQYVHI